VSASGPRRRAIIAALPVAAGLAACTSPRQPQPAALDFFTEHQAAVVEAATARIAPGPNDDPAEAGHPGAREAGVTRMVTIGTDVATSRAAIELASREANVWAAVERHSLP